MELIALLNLSLWVVNLVCFVYNRNWFNLAASYICLVVATICFMGG